MFNIDSRKDVTSFFFYLFLFYTSFTDFEGWIQGVSGELCNRFEAIVAETVRLFQMFPIISGRL